MKYETLSFALIIGLLAIFLGIQPYLKAWWYQHASVEEEYNDAATQYDKRWQRYTNVTIEEMMSRALPILARMPCHPHCSLLNVGCGTGALAFAVKTQFPSWQVTCSDVSTEMVKVAEKLRSLNVVVASSESLPFPDSTFDIVTTSSSFHFWQNHTSAVCGEIKRVLRPGGIFLMSDWSHDFISCKICSIYLRLMGHPPSAYTIWSIQQVRDLLSVCGLVIQNEFLYEIPLRPFGISFAPKWGMMTIAAAKT